MRKRFFLTILIIALLPGFSFALTVNLDVSNVGLYDSTGSLVEGNFLTAYVTVSGTTANFSVDPNEAILGGTLSNYGIDQFAFNTTIDSLKIDDFSLPTGWSLTINPNRSFSIFGKFDVGTSGTGNTRYNPLVFSINNSLIISDEQFFDPDEDGNTMVAHVGDIGPFTDSSGKEETSAWFSNGTQVSVPDASIFLLLGPSLLALRLFGKKSRNL
jgi:hypothetical protein